MAFFDTGVAEVWEGRSVIPADRAVQKRKDNTGRARFHL